MELGSCVAGGNIDLLLRGGLWVVYFGTRLGGRIKVRFEFSICLKERRWRAPLRACPRVVIELPRDYTCFYEFDGSISHG